MGRLILPSGSTGTINSTLTNKNGEVAYDTTKDRIVTKLSAGIRKLLTDDPADLMTGWTSLVLTNNWANYDTNFWPSARIRRTTSGTVFIEGLIRAGTTTSGTLLANIPAGMRPSGLMRVAAASGAGQAVVGVSPQGALTTIFVPASYDWLSISITYSTSE